MARTRNPLIGAAIPLLVVLAWQAVATFDSNYELSYLPAPDRIVAALVSEVSHGTLVTDLGHTLAVVLAATTLATLVGGGLGVLLGLRPVSRTWLGASVDVLRTVPALALMPVALLLFGPRVLTEVLLATWAASWPVLLTTAAGVAAVPNRLRDVARVLHLSPMTTLRAIVLPAALPSWLAGARTSVIVALHVAVIAEMLVVPHGLGGGLIGSLHALDPERMWAYAVACALVGVVLHRPLRHAAGMGRPESDGRPASWRGMSTTGAVSGLLPLGAVLVVWQLLETYTARPLPPPSEWLDAVRGLHFAGQLLPALGGTLGTAAAALLVATVVGAGLGLIIGASGRSERLLGPALDLAASVPGAAIVPVAVLVLGTSRLTSIVVVALAVTWPILLSTATAARNIPMIRLESARTLGLGRVTRWRAVVVPSAVPGIALGVRVAAAQALIVTLLVDQVGPADGVGRLMFEAQQSFDAATAWGLVAIVGVVGYLTSTTLGALERRLLRHRR